MKGTGIADLPLHDGHAPRWLFDRMVKLSGKISKTVIEEHGTEELLKRLTDPYWFQAFACTIGFDWHSSGTTTTTLGALKIAIDPQEYGIAVLGGKGASSRKTPKEINRLEEVFPIKSSTLNSLVRSSKLAAKVDNACVQDSHQLYHHSFIVTENSDWGVVQQGMKPEEGYARRYHWISDDLADFVEEPHLGICGENIQPEVLDMTSRSSKETRKTSVDLINDGPSRLRRYLSSKGQSSLLDFTDETLKMPERHAVLDVDISKKGWEVLNNAYELQVDDFEELVSIRGMGPKRIRALALVADLIYGSKASWKDPVKYSFAHGGKDGTPFPVNREVYDDTINTLKRDLEAAELDNKDQNRVLRKLNSLLSDSGKLPQRL